MPGAGRFARWRTGSSPPPRQVSTSFQIQLELTGLSRIGINPLETLRQNITGYRRTDELNQ